MAFEYKLEFSYDISTPSDAAVYIQMRKNPPIYRSHIDKENYDVLPDEAKHEWLTGLFNISGVVELSSKAYRIWIMKSPVFTWEEVLLPVLHFMRTWFEEEVLYEMPGSASIDGTGRPLASPSERRDI